MSEEKQPIIIRKKKKVAGHGGHHGGAWKVAYADFVTAMMAFFLVMWLMGADEETKASIENYFQGKSVSRDKGGSGPDAGEGIQGRFEEKSLDQAAHAAPVHLEEYAVLKELSDYYEGAAFTREVEGDVVKYILSKRLFFDPGSVNLSNTPESRTLILRLINVFKQHDGVIQIDGFADNVQDWSLGYGRAITVRRLLVDSGINEEKLVPMAAYELDKTGRVKDVNELDRGTVRFTLKRNRNHE